MPNVRFRPRLCKNSRPHPLTEGAFVLGPQLWIAAMSGLAPRIAITRFRL
jgi:hypothetical protein